MRRDFLKLCGLAGIGLSIPVRAATPTKEPDPYEGPFYVTFNASGGWDTTYMMDPKGVGGINRLYKEGDIFNQGNHHFAPIAEHMKPGMSNEAFFTEYGSDLLVLNGLDYSVNNHSPCARYTATGKLDSLIYPTFPALVAACKGPDCPLAFLSFGNYSATGNLLPLSRVNYLPSLKLLANADGVQGRADVQYHDDFVQDRIEQTLQQQLEMRQASSQLPRARRTQSMLYAAQANSKALKRVNPHIPKTYPKERLKQQVEIALAAFKAGVAVSANLSIGQFDSHANNDRDQMKLIPEFLDGVHHLMMRAEALGIRDQLVVVMQSEMGRTPHYNKGEGKDHWSIGSAMFMGKAIKGNRAIGATDEKQRLKPINAKTLKLADDGIRVRPEHLHAALRHHAGITEHEMAKKFPFEVKKEEQINHLWG